MKPNHTNRKRKGSAILEFALGWGILGALLSGGFQYGFTFWMYNTLQAHCYSAALYGSTLSYDTGNAAAYTTALQNVVVYGDPNGGTSALFPGVGIANVNVSVNTNSSIPTDVTVSIVNYNVNAIFGSYTFNNKPRVTMAYIGQVACSSC
jgi:hypothetical protein